MNIKNIICLFLCFCTVFVFCACGNGSESDKTAEGGTASVTTADGQNSGTAKEDGGIDVDLTSLSSTMVYSEVYNMLSVPESYIGKNVKMEGAFAVYHDEVTDKYYYACIIQDATACCSQGLEFELDGDYKYPDDYPQEGEDIKVKGTFDTYQEGDKSYCVLRKASLLE